MRRRMRVRWRMEMPWEIKAQLEEVNTLRNAYDTHTPRVFRALELNETRAYKLTNI